VATNEDQKRETKILPKEVQKAVVDAVRTLKRETGGVDLIFDKEENPYIAEVNFPNDFHTAQKVTKIDIAGKMIDYLIEKEKNTDSK
jgi:glutathione synthase/RimK-type ligase-like ATP-grasp enzyme